MDLQPLSTQLSEGTTETIPFWFGGAMICQWKASKLPFSKHICLPYVEHCSVRYPGKWYGGEGFDYDITYLRMCAMMCRWKPPKLPFSKHTFPALLEHCPVCSSGKRYGIAKVWLRNSTVKRHTMEIKKENDKRDEKFNTPTERTSSNIHKLPACVERCSVRYRGKWCGSAKIWPLPIFAWSFWK